MHSTVFILTQLCQHTGTKRNTSNANLERIWRRKRSGAKHENSKPQSLFTYWQKKRCNLKNQQRHSWKWHRYWRILKNKQSQKCYSVEWETETKVKIIRLQIGRKKNCWCDKKRHWFSGIYYANDFGAWNKLTNLVKRLSTTNDRKLPWTLYESGSEVPKFTNYSAKWFSVPRIETELNWESMD